MSCAAARHRNPSASLARATFTAVFNMPRGDGDGDAGAAHIRRRAQSCAVLYEGCAEFCGMKKLRATKKSDGAG